MTFLATDTSVLSTAQQQCSQVVDISTAHTMTPNDDPHVPPIFSAITKKFEQTRKVIYCAYTSRKRRIHVISSKSFKKLKTGVSACKNDLKDVVSHTPGRLKSKRRRYKFKFPRQVSSDVKSNQLKLLQYLCEVNI